MTQVRPQRRGGRHVRPVCAGAMVVLLLATAQSALLAAERIPIDRALIIVNDKMVTQREFNETRGFQARAYRQEFKGSELESKLMELDASIRKEVVESLLLEAQAERLGIQATDDEIAERVSSIIARDPRITSVYSDQALREFVLKDLLRKRVIQQEVNSRVFVAPDEVREACRAALRALREIDVGHILLREGEGEDPRIRLEDMARKLREGDSFEKLAETYSEDPGAATNKGRLGFIAKGQFFAAFEEAAFALDVGEISPPVKTRLGYHLIKVFGERSKERTNCDNLEDLNQNRFYNQVWTNKRNAELDRYLDKLRANADIVVNEK